MKVVKKIKHEDYVILKNVIDKDFCDKIVEHCNNNIKKKEATVWGEGLEPKIKKEVEKKLLRTQSKKIMKY